MDTTARVVLGQPPHDVGGVTSVVARWILRIPKDAHEPFGHASQRACFLPCEITARSQASENDAVFPETAVVGERLSGPPSLVRDSQRATVDILRLVRELAGVKRHLRMSVQRRMASHPKLAHECSRAKDGTGTGFCERLVREVRRDCCLTPARFLLFRPRAISSQRESSSSPA